MKLSVAMAAYNGEKYIKEQIDSIMCQLGMDDELCISVDPSTDETYRICNKMSEEDPRIKVSMGLGRGVKTNFEQAIKMCTGDIIFLSDQDDIWDPNKVMDVLSCFIETNALLIVHDAMVCNDDCSRALIPSYFKYRGSKPGTMANIAKNSYMGCCMAFRAELVPYCLPIPESVPMHDQWIGLVAERKGDVHFLNKQLIKYRRHSNNTTDITHSEVGNMMKWRIAILNALMKVK